MIPSAYRDEERVRAVMAYLSGVGIGCLESHWLARDEGGHVSELLKRMEPRPFARILDVGCGTGAVATRMVEFRPDLEFVLLNPSKAQLELCPPDMEKIHREFKDVPLPDRSMDVVMFVYSLGHMNLDEAMVETYRLLKVGGEVFIYELVSEGRTLHGMEYEARSPRAIREAGERAGFECLSIEFPEFFTDHCGLIPGSEVLLDGTRPAVLKMRRNDVGSRGNA